MSLVLAKLLPKSDLIQTGRERLNMVNGVLDNSSELWLRMSCLREHGGMCFKRDPSLDKGQGRKARGRTKT